MKYADIKIENDDLKTDDSQAVIIYDRDVIIQDLIHAIRENGYLIELIAERGVERRQLLITQIILLAEEDERLIPGTIVITAGVKTQDFASLLGTWTLTAETYDFGNINLQLSS